MPSSSRVEDDIELINSPVTLPNGVVVPNRLVKVSDSLPTVNPVTSVTHH